MSIYATMFEMCEEDPEFRDARPPYVYPGNGPPTDARIEHLMLCEAVPWCSETPYLRMSVSEQTSLIDVDQALAIRNFLDWWLLNRVRNWKEIAEEEG